jgi:hypothetical protein
MADLALKATKSCAARSTINGFISPRGADIPALRHTGVGGIAASVMLRAAGAEVAVRQGSGAGHHL